MARALNLSRGLAAIMALAVVYAGVAQLALAAAVLHGAAPVWPPAGLALFTLVAWPDQRRLACGIALGELLAMVLSGTPAWAGAVMGVGNATAALAGAALFRRAGTRPQLDRLGDVVRFVLLSAFTPTLLAATIGTATLFATGAIHSEAVVSTWRVWWLGDIAGVLVFAPPLFALHKRRRPVITLDAVVSMVILIAVAFAVLGTGDGQPYVVFPLLAWLGLRLGPSGAATANLVCALIAVRLAVAGHGPFADATIAASLLQCQTFLLVMAVTSLVLAAMGAELRASQRAHAQLADEQAALRRVAEAVARQDDPAAVRALADHELHAVVHEDSRAQVERLVGVATDTAEARAQLVRQATTDPLTGLANHGAFHERVAAELAYALATGRPLALAILDLDGFKRVNDSFGHLAGDAVLRAAAQALREHARPTDVVARLGGDELALLAPGADAAELLAGAERFRRAIERAQLGPDGTVTASIGICDLRDAGTAERLLRHADDALYWVKARGGNACCAYDAQLIADDAPEAARNRRERAEAVSGLRALARAIDARDPTTSRHSERVAQLAARLAEACGWSREDVAALRQAGLVHDIGKLVVPDAILFKPGRLTPEERRRIEQHAAAGAEIAAELLSSQQVGWIRGHHERWDGTGYPDALGASDIPAGARLLALADAWDAMTVARPYSQPLTPARALEECIAQRGLQFDPEAVDALCRLGGVRPRGELRSERWPESSTLVCAPTMSSAPRSTTTGGPGPASSRRSAGRPGTTKSPSWLH